MTLASGSRLGPYEIVAPIGAGGMGEVYRASDTRLKRDVAVKVLPTAFATDAERLRRFEQEAQAASGLNHPNILSIYDLGNHDGAPYIVSELLEGETLRSRLAGGAFTPRRAIGHALQMAQGLAAAHEKGIVHRDLKPENVFVTNDGRVKILDFGLARVTQPEGPGPSATNLPTVTPGTEPGVVLGTMGYMSPEQVRGKSADARSDIFSFGAILYEMLSGRRAFHGETEADTISAILTRDPPDLSETNRKIPESLDRIVRHCLERSPQARFHSASDIAFDLEAISGVSGVMVPEVGARRGRPRPWLLLLAGVASAAALLAAVWIGATLRKPAPARYQQLTFRRGRILNARFTPDGQTVLYTAMWGSEPPRIYSVRLGSPESSALSFSNAALGAVSSTGELALGLRPRPSGSGLTATLSRAPLSGGAPREVLTDVGATDWAPDGQELAVAHLVGGRARLEFPIGKVLYESKGRVADVRVSPRGDHVAIADWPVPGDIVGSVVVVDRAGRSRILSSDWYDLSSVCWRPGGDEVWFSASASGLRDSIWAVKLTGKRHLVAEVPGSIRLEAISPAGRVLVTLGNYRCSMIGVPPGDTAERDVSWLDFSYPIDLSEDGKTLLFEEWGEGGGPRGAVYLRRFDGSDPVRLGDGLGLALSPDGQWVLTRLYTQPPRLLLLPTGAGQPRPVPAGEGLHYEEWGQFLPGGSRIAFTATEAGRGRRIYVQDLAGGKPRPVTRDAAVGFAPINSHGVSPDGRFVAALGTDDRVTLFPLEGGEPRLVFGADPGDRPLRWSADGRWLYVRSIEGATVRLFRIEMSSGRREPWKEPHPDPAGLMIDNTGVVLTPDGKTYFCGFQHRLNELYLAEGLK
ncbi:MAG TPA: protein kinase [Thermoanaerobaculia bacterium]|jgi:hypothetical protein